MPARRSFLRTILVTALLAGVCHAQAVPEGRVDAQDDPVLQLLQDKGLLDKVLSPSAMAEGSQGLVRQVRDAASDLVISAMHFLGVPYRRGGDSPDDGFDCSGFTRHIFEHSLGLVLPRRADQQAHGAGLQSIARDELKPGDLVFFNTMRRAFSHVGIYVGDGKFIHAPRTGAQVRLEDLRASYWSRRFNGARRAPAVAAAVPSSHGGSHNATRP